MPDLVKKLFKLDKDVLLNRDTFLQWLANVPDDRKFRIAIACPFSNHEPDKCGCMLHEYFADHLRKTESINNFISVGSGGYLTHYTEVSGPSNLEVALPSWCRDVINVFDNNYGKAVDSNTSVTKQTFVDSITKRWVVSLPPKQINENDNFTISVKRLKEKRNFISWLRRQPKKRHYKTGTDCLVDCFEACGCMLYEYIADHSVDSVKPVVVGYGKQDSIRSLCTGRLSFPILKYPPLWMNEVVQVFDSGECGLGTVKREPFLTKILQKWGLGSA